MRVRPDVRCTQLKSYASLLGVMLHEITHISIGLEDIAVDPNSFTSELLEIKNGTK